jgi:hypothetical protein
VGYPSVAIPKIFKEVGRVLKLKNTTHDLAKWAFLHRAYSYLVIIRLTTLGRTLLKLGIHPQFLLN